MDRQFELGILDHVKTMVCVLDDEGRVVHVNRTAVSLLEAEGPEALIGRAFVEFVTPLYREVIDVFLAGELDGHAAEELPVKMLTETGRQLDVKLRLLSGLESPTFGGRRVVLGQDVSGLIRYGEGILRSERRFRDMVATSMFLKAVCHWPRIVFINKAGARLLGASDSDKLVGRAITEFIQPDYRFVFEEGIEALLEETGSVPLKVMPLTGGERDMQFSFYRVGLSQPPEVMIEARDITSHNNAVAALKEMIETLEARVEVRTEELTCEIKERRKAEIRIRYQAHYDALTGLPNRNLFFNTLPKTLEGMEKSGEKLALMFIDLDGFKDVNDLLGHDAGDALLKETGQRLVASVRPRDIVARLGGDEFTVILPALRKTEDIAPIARRVLRNLRQPFVLDGREANVSGSIGIAIFPEDAIDAESLIKSADAAMYLAKEQGKANYQFFTRALRQREAENQAISRALERALDGEEFSLLYLPKFSLRDQRITGVEALLRWRNPALGMVDPKRFIPLLEERGLIGKVGDWVLRAAGQQWHAWRKAYGLNLKLSLNISARQLRARDFADQFLEQLAAVGLEPEQVELEITETSVIAQRSRATDVLRALHDAGVALTLDDFGTGYASLRYLQSLPITSVKIDRTFVATIASDDEDWAIVQGIVNMAHGLGKSVVAEGVETREQLHKLEALGCDEVQGFFFSPPLSVGDMEEFLRGTVGEMALQI